MKGILETALLGTEKRALDLSVLPAPIREELVDSHADPDITFLKACAYYFFYESAGRMPLRLESTPEVNIVEEISPEGAPNLTKLVTQIEAVDYQIRETLLVMWLDVLIQNKWLVKPEQINTLLEIGKNFSNATKNKIVKVIGRKGELVLSYRDELDYKIRQQEKSVWHEGTPQERRDILNGMRTTDPVQSLDLLRSTWETEGVVAKKMFLEVLEETSVESDLDFVQDLYDNEFTYRAKEKKTERECRKILASILIKYSQTHLYKSTFEKISRYVAKSKKGLVAFVTGKESIGLELPETSDEFWNERVMEEVYAFDTKGIDHAVYPEPIYFWLGCFLRYFPFQFWVDLFAVDMRVCAKYFLTSERFVFRKDGNKFRMFQSDLTDNAIAFQHAELAICLLDEIKGVETNPLLSLLTLWEYESYVIKNKYLTDVEVLASGPTDDGSTWSLKFSEMIIEKIYDITVDDKTPAYLAKVALRQLHPDSVKMLEYFNNRVRDTKFANAWNVIVFEPLFAALDLRKKINAFNQ